MTIWRVLKVVSLTLIVAAIPAIFIFFSSLWTVRVTAEAERKEDALVILADDVLFAKNRHARVDSLDPARNRRPARMPVIELAEPGELLKPPLHIRLPSCFGPEVMDDPEKLRRYRATGYPYLFRIRQIEETRNLIFARKVGVTRLALLKSCLIATPFSDSCGAWLDGQSVGDEAVAELLETKKLLENLDGELCWPQRELAGSAPGENE